MGISDNKIYTGKIVRRINVEKNLTTNTKCFYEKSDAYWHYHENLNICYVFEGNAIQTKRKKLATKNNTNIFFHHSGEMHLWSSPKPISKSINIEISHDFLKKNDLTECDIENSILTNIDTKSLMLKMLKELQLNEDSSSAAVQSILLELVNYSNAHCSNKVPSWVKILQELLNDNWNNQLQLNEMARIAGVHPVTMSKYFRKYFFCTLGEYQRKLKTNRSIGLIKNSQLSLSEIAFECGFSDQSHFIRNFKQQTSFLPKNFQRL